MQQYAFGDRNCTPVPDVPSLLQHHQSGVYFRHNVTLPAGTYTVLVQTQLHRRTPEAELRISVGAGVEEDPLASTTQRLSFDGTDRILLTFDLPAHGLCEIHGWVDRDLYGTLLRFLTLVPGEVTDAADPRFWYTPTSPTGDFIDTIIMGTTTKCPASCLSCPTNKPTRQAIPKGVMPVALFEEIIDDLAEIGFSGSIIFGLYGEPLMDPHFAKRMKKIKATLPKCRILLATTGSTYVPETHGEIIDLVDGVAIHMEAISTDTYNTMMHPLKAERSFPRIDALLKGAWYKSHIVMPIGRSNISQIAPITTYSRKMGVCTPDFTSLSNRCGVSATFDEESLAPVATCCSPAKIARELIVDWDGTVVACCFDFMREGTMGNLSKTRLRDFLGGAERQAFIDKFNKKEWHDLKACRGCRIDDVLQTERLVSTVTTVQTNIIRLPSQKFQFSPDMERADGGLLASGQAAAAVAPPPPPRRLPAPLRPFKALLGAGGDTMVMDAEAKKAPQVPVMVNRIWGPYHMLARGAYTVQLHIEPMAWGHQSRILWQVIVDEEVLASREYSEATAAGLSATMPIKTTADGTIQIRIASYGADFKFKGVTIVAGD